MHVVVEDQIATGYGPSKRAMARLQQEGLSRHEALHAIGSVVADLYFESTRNPQANEPDELQSRMNDAIERLSAAQWKNRYGS
jgi:NAD(P)H-dependent FMN reductase